MTWTAFAIIAMFHVLHIGICLANTNIKMNKTSQLKDGNQLMGLWQSIELVDLENVSGGGGAGLRQAGHRALARRDPAVRLRLVDRLSSRGLQVLDAGQHLGSEVRAFSGGMLGAGS